MPSLQPTSKAPDFSGQAVVNGEFKDISLSQYKGKYVILLFYPADFTFVCPTEIIAFSDRAEEFRKEGCEVIAVSTDSHFTHLAWTNTPREAGGLGKMNIPLLADRTQQISASYGVLKVIIIIDYFWNPICLKFVMNTFHLIMNSWFQFQEDEGVAFRGLFIIDGNGVLRQITVNDLPVGRDVDETLRLVQAFKFTDEHGEVCPAGWRKGKKTMKPTKEGVSNYLASQAQNGAH